MPRRRTPRKARSLLRSLLPAASRKRAPRPPKPARAPKAGRLPEIVPLPGALPAIPRPARRRQGSGRWVRGGRSAPVGGRSYDVYLPAGLRPRSRVPMVLLLHGCGQTAAEFASATRFTDVADRNGFVLVLPHQETRHHPNRCWRWYEARQPEPRGGRAGRAHGGRAPGPRGAGAVAYRPAPRVRGRAVGRWRDGAHPRRHLPGRLRRRRRALRSALPLREQRGTGPLRDGGAHDRAAAGARCRHRDGAGRRPAGHCRPRGAAAQRRPGRRPVARVPDRRGRRWPGPRPDRPHPHRLRTHDRRPRVHGRALVLGARPEDARVLAGGRPRPRVVRGPQAAARTATPSARGRPRSCGSSSGRTAAPARPWPGAPSVCDRLSPGSRAAPATATGGAASTSSSTRSAGSARG